MPKYTVFLRNGEAVSTSDEAYKKWYANDSDCKILASGVTGHQAGVLMRAANHPEIAVKTILKLWKAKR